MKYILAILVASLGTSLSALAQEIPAECIVSANKEEVPNAAACTSAVARLEEEKTRFREGTVGTGSAATLKRPTLIVSGGEESSKATLSAGVTVGGPDIDENGRLNTYSIQFHVQTPIDKKAEDSRTNIASLDDISNGTTLGMTFSRTLIGGYNNLENCNFRGYQRDVAAICRSNAKELGVAPGVCEAIDAYAQEEALPAGITNDDVANLLNKIKESNETKKKVSDSLEKSGCNAVTGKNADYLSYGTKLQLGFDEFSVLDTGTFEEATVDESPFSASLFALYAPKSEKIANTTAYVFGLQYKDGYKASDSLTICRPYGEGELQECKTGAVEGPVDDDDFTVFAELRKGFEIPLNGSDYNIAIQPRLAFDMEDDEYGFDVPIYLVPGKDDLLTGGLRLGWDSEDNDLTLGLFFGATFDVFGPVK